MIKNPFNKEGKLNVLDLFKIVFLSSFIIVWISKALETNMFLMNSSPSLNIIANILIVIQFVLTSKSIFEEVIAIIEGIIIKLIEYSTFFNADQKEPNYTIKEVILPENKSYIKLSVVRC